MTDQDIVEKLRYPLWSFTTHAEPIDHIENARDLMADAAMEIEALRDENHVYHAEIGRLKDMIELLYKASK